MTGKTKIQNALLELMCEKEFHKISIMDIINRANVNRSTYYYHYYYQTEIIDELCDNILEEIKQINLKPSQLSSTHYQNMIEESLNVWRKHKDILKIIMNSSVENRFKDKYHNLYFFPFPNRAILPRTTEHGRFTAEFYFAGSYSIIRMWILDDCRMPAKDLKQFFNLISHKLDD